MGKQWKTAGRKAQAEKKGALFTKLSREIQVAVRLMGPDPASNHRLKLALETARSHCLSKSTITRAIAKGAGQKPEDHIEEVIYEGFGPYGVAVIVHCLTDNRVRTVSEIRYLFKKHKGNMDGSVMWIFDKVALVQARKAVSGSVEEEALSAGAEDLEQRKNSYLFYGKREDLNILRENLIQKGWNIIKTKSAYRARNKIALNKEQTQSVCALLELLEAHPDCQAIYTNLA